MNWAKKNWDLWFHSYIKHCICERRQVCTMFVRWKENLCNPFLANISILYPLKTPFSGIFRGYKMGTFQKWVKAFLILLYFNPFVPKRPFLYPLIFAFYNSVNSVTLFTHTLLRCVCYFSLVIFDWLYWKLALK